MLPQALCIHMCISPVISEKHCLLGGVCWLWILYSFHMFIYILSWIFSGEVDEDVLIRTVYYKASHSLHIVHFHVSEFIFISCLVVNNKILYKTLKIFDSEIVIFVYICMSEYVHVPCRPRSFEDVWSPLAGICRSLWNCGTWVLGIKLDLPEEQRVLLTVETCLEL